METKGLDIPPELVDRAIRRAVEIQQIPAPTFQEGPRAAYVRERFLRAGLSQVTEDPLHNVCALRHGGGRGAILVSAHLDDVFPDSVDRTMRRKPGRIAAPGIGDNALGVASLIALAESLDALGVSLPMDLHLAANVCEEGLGDLRGIKGVLARLGGRLSAAIVVEGQRLGRINHQGVGSQRYRLACRTAGGHSWSDYPAPSAVHALMALGGRLLEIDVPSHPRTTFNIGVIQGGTSVNSIAEEASCLLDLRSESPEALDALVRLVEQVVQSWTARGTSVSLEVIGQRPAGGLDPAHPLVLIARDVLRELGVHDVHLTASSTDANVPLAAGLPAVCVGITRGGNAHRADEFIETAPIATGLGQLLRLVRRVADSADRW
jgi:acetylornithine deacetylase/succinyl-diaminopimelate desuccinylase-like protein